MNTHNGWNSLGDTRELERKVKRIRDIEDMAEWGDKTLKLIADMDYLNGCVKRGRGSDIAPDYPAQNVFGYIKELESTITALTQEIKDSDEYQTYIFKVWADQLDDLRKEVEVLTQERDKLAEECLTVLSGSVPTPAEGYVKAGMRWIASDIQSLVKALSRAREGTEFAVRNHARTLTQIGSDAESLKEFMDNYDTVVKERDALKAYKHAIDDAMVCWEMATTGDAKADLNKLLCIEQQVAIDPAVSDSARELQKKTAQRCSEIAKNFKIEWASCLNRDQIPEAVSDAIRAEYGL